MLEMINCHLLLNHYQPYAARYDMITTIVSNRVLPPIVFTPEDRKTRNVKGINSDMFIDFIENFLFSSITELDLCPMYHMYLVYYINPTCIMYQKLDKLFVILDT
jgi:hypothetical protein